MSATRNPWPIGIGIFIGLFFLSMVAFVVWSLGHRQDLVAPDYHAQDLAYQSVIDSEQRARALGLDPLRVANGRLEICLPPDSSNAILSLYRPSDARLDAEQPIALDAEGRASRSIDELAPGRWRASLTWNFREVLHKAKIDFISARPVSPAQPDYHP